MKVIIEDLAKENVLKIFSYNSRYSIKNAIATNMDIKMYVNVLANSPFIGRYIPEMSDKSFREIIYRKTRHSGYRIMYYISEKNDTVYVFNIMNCKQDFNNILKLHNYFNNYFNF